MADSGSTQSASQAQSGLNEANEASQSESEKAAVQRMHQATQAEAEARRQLEEAYQENQRLAQQLQTPPQKDLLEDEEYLESVRDDPSNIKELINQREARLRGEFADTIRAVVDDVHGKIVQVDPERIQFSSQLEEARKESWTDGLNDESVIKVLKRDKDQGFIKKNDRVPGRPTGERSSANREEELPTGDMDALKRTGAYDSMWGEEIADLDRQLERLKDG